MRENIQEILELADYNVTAVENGKLGLKAAIQKRPDLILCDVMMPTMDGYETLFFMNKKSETANIPFIFLTAKTEKEDFRKGMNLGADDYLTKPFDEMELLNVIETRLAKIASITNNTSINKSFTKKHLNNYDALDEYFKTKKKSLYSKKEIVFKEGDSTTYLYYLASGKIRTFKLNEQAKELTTGLYTDGDFLGYLPIIKDVEQPDTAIVMDEAEIIRIPKNDFKHLISTNSNIAKEFLTMLTSNILEKEKKMLGLAYNSVRKRVSEALLLLHHKFKNDEDNSFTMSISRDNLASIVGTTTESVIRVLSDFKAEGLIKISGSKITIIQLELLSSMKN